MPITPVYDVKIASLKAFKGNSNSEFGLPNCIGAGTLFGWESKN